MEEPLLDCVCVVLLSPVVPLFNDELCNVLGVLKPDDGSVPGACWMSLPCSAINAGPSFGNAFLSCGTIWLRTSSLTGSLDASSP